MNKVNLMFSELISEIIKEKYSDAKKINNLKIQISKKYNFKGIIRNSEIISYSNKKDRNKIIKLLNIKPIRELSGVTVVALFAKPWACPHGKCIYCPGGPNSEFGNTPQSYTGSEPAALRAIRNNYDPYLQIFNRLEHYVINGHLPDKIELIFMGGTFPSLEKEYKEEFVNYVYKAINDFGDEFLYYEKSSKQKKINYDKFNKFFETLRYISNNNNNNNNNTIEKNNSFNSVEFQNKLHKKILKLKNKNIKNYKEEIKRNETNIIRSIGLTIETKPDWALEKHCSEMLEYGCTRFEVGVQTLNENCLKKTNRGHTLKETIKSFQIMKDMCFKINAHMMIGLPNSTIEIDKQSLIDLFKLEEFRPDMLKIYPCLVIKGTSLFKLWEKGLFKPIETENAAKIIAESYKFFPRYVRVMRVQRDIPTPLISGGVKNSNLRQFVDKEMIKKNIKSKDIRSREIGFRQLQNTELGKFKINVEEYDSSSGKDFFIDVVDEKDTMIGFIRLRFPSKYGYRKEITKGTALIRELHIYGQILSVGENINKEKFQHKGWGSKLLKKAEEIAKKAGYNKLAIISGIGVREYYKKFDYKLNGVYMIKTLK